MEAGSVRHTLNSVPRAGWNTHDCPGNRHCCIRSRFQRNSTRRASSSSRRQQYDMDHPRFNYDFFETDMAGNRTGQSYNRLVLRNGGSDHEGTMIKWNVVSRLGEGSRHHLCRSKARSPVRERRVLRHYPAAGEIHPVQRGMRPLVHRKSDIEKYEPNEVNSSQVRRILRNRLHADLNDPERQAKPGSIGGHAGYAAALCCKLHYE